MCFALTPSQPDVIALGGVIGCSLICINPTEPPAKLKLPVQTEKCVHCGHSWNSTSCVTRVKSSSDFMPVPRALCCFGWLDVCGFAALSYQSSFPAGSKLSLCIVVPILCPSYLQRKKKRKKEERRKKIISTKYIWRKKNTKNEKMRHVPTVLFLSPYSKKAHKGDTLRFCFGLRGPVRLVVILLWRGDGCQAVINTAVAFWSHSEIKTNDSCLW